MNNLTVKEVPFNGATLMAAQDRETQKVYVGVNWVCKGIGLTEDQMKNERKKVQTDIVLSKGGSNLTLPTKGGKQEALCLELDFVPLWLAKISITPRMQEEQPELTERLVDYQLRAKDVLAAAFLPETQTNYDNLSPALQLFNQMFKAVAENEARIQQVETAVTATSQRLDNIGEIISLDTNDWRKQGKQLIVKIAQAMGGYEYIREVNRTIYDLLDMRFGVSLETRLTNKRRRMADEGVCKSKRDKVSKVDIIAEDKKLIEGYVLIIKEMAVKYGVDSYQTPA